MSIGPGTGLLQQQQLTAAAGAERSLEGASRRCECWVRDWIAAATVTAVSISPGDSV